MHWSYAFLTLTHQSKRHEYKFLNPSSVNNIQGNLYHDRGDKQNELLKVVATILFHKIVNFQLIQ